MRFLIYLISLSLVVSCVHQRRTPRQASRPSHSDFTELDSLEMLLLKEDHPIHQFHQERSHLQIGMNKRKVTLSLGEPSQREVAGNPKYENERWIYNRRIPTLNGEYQERHIIYFESGSVVGWEIQ